MTSLRIECLINLWWDGLDFSAKLMFDTIEVVSVLKGDEVDGKTKMTETTRSTDSVQVCLRVLREIKVDNNIHRLYIDTSCEQI